MFYQRFFMIYSHFVLIQIELAVAFDYCTDLSKLTGRNLQTDVINLRNMERLRQFLLMNANVTEMKHIDLAKCYKIMENLIFIDFSMYQLNSNNTSPGLFQVHFNKESPSQIQIKVPNKLNFLVIEETSIEHLDPRALLNGLTDIKSFSFSSSTLIDIKSCLLNENKISYSIELYDLHMKSSKQLRFYSCQYNILFEVAIRRTSMEIIESGSFESLVNLGNLEFESNQIKEIEPYAFSGLSRLKSLKLRKSLIKTIRNNIFDGLYFLKELDLSYNQIDTIEPEGFSGLAYLLKLKLYSNRLKSISSRWFDYFNLLNSLDLANNMLNLLNDTLSFKCKNMLNSVKFSLNLQDNSLNGQKNEHIKLRIKRSNALNSLSLNLNSLGRIRSFKSIELISDVEIESLSLDNNGLSFLENISFYGLNNLIKLSLQMNSITTIDKVQLNGVENLKELDLSFNQIKSVRQVNIFGLANLVKIDLTSNKIEYLDEVNLNGVPKLECLILSYNQIKSIDSVFFKGLKNLIQLELYDNRIERIDNVSFHGIEHLNILKIGSNLINSIEIVKMKGVTFLEELSISHNQIQIEIKENMILMFDGLKILRRLDISYNNMSLMRNVKFVGLESLKQLDLTNNPFKSLSDISIDGLPQLETIFLDGYASFNIDKSLVLNKGLSNNAILIIDLGRMFTKKMKPESFPLNHRLKLSYAERIYLDRPTEKDIIKNYLDYKTNFYFKYVLGSMSNVCRICSNSHIFLIKSSKYIRAYQSIPFQFDEKQQENMMKVNCSLMFALFRRCFIIRLFIGLKYDHDIFIQKCYEEENLELLTTIPNISFYCYFHLNRKL